MSIHLHLFVNSGCTHPCVTAWAQTIHWSQTTLGETASVKHSNEQFVHNDCKNNFNSIMPSPKSQCACMLLHDHMPWVCMCVWMCVCVWMWVCVCVCVNVSVCVCVWACVHVCVCERGACMCFTWFVLDIIKYFKYMGCFMFCLLLPNNCSQVGNKSSVVLYYTNP